MPRIVVAHAIMTIGLALSLLLQVACTQAPEATVAGPITTVTSDGVTVYGEPYLRGLDESAPLILLFHQGGSNGRGEYGSLASWLNDEGFRAIAWDQRSGGDTYGEANRTVSTLAEGTPANFCDAYADLQAALEYVTAQGFAEKVVVWGSSYSASLVFQLAGAYPDKVSGVIAFSPASGGPMVDCRARLWIENVNVPILVLRPASEMERESSAEQRDLLMEAGAEFQVVQNGIHGSSMLVDARTEHDMGDARSAVLNWLKEVTQHIP